MADLPTLIFSSLRIIEYKIIFVEGFLVIFSFQPSSFEVFSLQGKFSINILKSKSCLLNPKCVGELNAWAEAQSCKMLSIK